MTNSAWLKSFQLLSSILDFVSELSENKDGINKIWGRWSCIVEVRLPHTASFETLLESILSTMAYEWPVALVGCRIYDK